MRANDAVGGLVLVILAAVMAALTIPFPSFPGQKYGPDLLPLILSGGLTVCGLLLIVRGLKARAAGERWVVVAPWLGQPAKVMRFVLVIVSLLFYIVAADPLGFVPVSVVIIAALSIAFGARPLPAAATAIAATLAINYFFGSIMRVPLPRGLIDLVL